jgi:uncharacterized membrane protein
LSERATNDSEGKTAIGENWIAPELRSALSRFGRSGYRNIILASVAVFVASAIFHWPTFHVYSDITTSFWSRANAAGTPYLTYQIPYVNYVFEYPPVCGLVVWLGGWLSAGSLNTYAAVEFTILGIFFVLTTHFLYRFLGKLGMDQNLQILFTLLVPSAVAFAAYNFDVIVTFFMVFALYLFVVKKDQNLSAISLGFAVATKLFPVLLVPIFLQDIKASDKKIKFALISIGVPLGMNLPFMISNYSNWLAGYLYLKNWGLEDTFLIWLFPSRGSYPLAEAISGVLILISVCGIYLFLGKQPLLIRCFLVVGCFVLLSYISPPQLNLDLLPFFALVPIVPLPLFYGLEATNATFISLWDSFPDASLPGVVQAIALARQLCIAAVIGLVAVRAFYIQQSSLGRECLSQKLEGANEALSVERLNL